MLLRFSGYLPKMPRNKTRPSKIVKMPIPDEIRICFDPVRYKSRIMVDDPLEIGQDIAKPYFDSLPDMVSPVKGVVVAINNTLDMYGNDAQEAVISKIDKDAEPDCETDESFLKLDRDVMFKKLVDFGITGKIKKSKRVVVNCCDTEPNLNAYKTVLAEYKHELPLLCDLAKHLVEAEEVYLALPHDMDIALPANVKKYELSCTYPASIPEVIAIDLSGHSSGAWVISIITMMNILYTLRQKMPMRDKFVSVVGKDGKCAGVFDATIGTKISDILKYAGINYSEHDKIVIGGTMRGISQYNPELGIDSHVNGITVVPANKNVQYTGAQCVNCGKCVLACPIKLQPNLLSRYAEYNSLEDLEIQGIHNCIECGICSYVCIARRPVMQYIAHGKRMIKNEEGTK